MNGFTGLEVENFTFPEAGEYTLYMLVREYRDRGFIVNVDFADDQETAVLDTSADQTQVAKLGDLNIGVAKVTFKRNRSDYGDPPVRPERRRAGFVLVRYYNR